MDSATDHGVITGSGNCLRRWPICNFMVSNYSDAGQEQCLAEKGIDRNNPRRGMGEATMGR
jgi:hypothetical protein